MAEANANQNQQNVYHIHINTAQHRNEETTVNVQGDVVQNKQTEIVAHEIGQIVIPSTNEGNAERNINTERGNVAEGVDAMNLGETSRDDKTKKKDRFGFLRKLGPNRDSRATQNQGNEGQEILKLRKACLRARATAYFSQAKFEEASELLEDLEKLHNTKNLDTLLMLTECYLQLGREVKANKSIKHVRQIVMAPFGLDVKYIMAVALDLIKNSSYIRPMILLRIAGDLLRASSCEPDNVMIEIATCIYETCRALKAMITLGNRSKIIALDHGIPYMEEMLDIMSEVKNADKMKLALKLGESTNDIGSVYFSAKRYEESIKINQRGVRQVDKHLEANASNYRIYGDLLHNIGVAYSSWHKYSEAKSFFEKALESRSNALDYKNETERNGELEKTRREIEKCKD